MAKRNYNLGPRRLVFEIVGACLLVATGCGRRDHGSTGSEVYSLPDALREPQLSPVPPGSRDVVASPPAGALRGTLLLKLFSETGAKIHYAFRPFAEDRAVETLLEYQDGVLLLPPVTIWAQAELDGRRGPVRSFAYSYDQSFWSDPEPLLARRLPLLPPTSIGEADGLAAFAAQGAAERLGQSVEVDGKVSDWSGQSRLAALDGTGDVPASQDYIDLAWAEAGETEDAIYVVIATKARPRNGDGVFYGVDFGPSNISSATFGPGTTFLYRAEVLRGTLVLQSKANGESIPSPGSEVSIGDVVEIKIAKADLPQLGSATDVAIRPYAVDFLRGTSVADRMEPFFLRSSFTMHRGVVDGGGRPWQVDLLVPPAAEDQRLPASYQELARTFLPELERINGLRVHVRGSIPLYLAEAEASGYAGLNTTDRGLLSTIGPMSGVLARAQILAHELAHFQNARHSGLKPRWLQEGMSEWTSERLLYRHFAPRAVHRFLKRLRFGRLVGIDPAADMPLDAWGKETATLGYEKSLAFLDLLETRLGQGPLLKAFQLAVNEPMDSKGFRTFLEAETGRDLGGLFTGWVDLGETAADVHPDLLFADPDGDGLMTLDEQARGTDPAQADTDRDGYPDGEEVFAGGDPLLSSLDPNEARSATTEPALVGAASPSLGSLARIGGARSQTFTYSLDPFDADPSRPYVRPMILRPPYSLAVKAHDANGAVVTTTLTRPLYVNGLAALVVPPDSAILPAAAVTTDQPRVGAKTAARVGGADGLPLTDAAGDLPPELAAYDLRETVIAEGDGTLDITLNTVASPDPLGGYGDYVISFTTVAWFEDVPSGVDDLYLHTPRFALSVVGGAPYWSVYDNGTRTTSLLTKGVGVTFAETLKVTLSETLLSDWYAAAGDKMVCIGTDVTLDGGEPFHERGGCLTLESPGLHRAAARLEDAYGVGEHTVEAFVSASTQGAARAASLADLGVFALKEFERALGRPLLERSFWPVHVRYRGAGQAQGAGSSKVGAYLSIAASDEGATLDYLVVEQLARIVVADTLARSGSAPYFVQEGYVQWLTAAAMYALTPTRDTWQFHAQRLAGYASYLAGGGALDRPLVEWSSQSPLGSRGSEKSLAFVLELNARLGSAAMSRAFSTFAHEVPGGDGWLSRLKGVSPVNTALLDGLWATWVVGSGDATADKATIRDRLLDPDGDDLMNFEESRLGTDPAVFTAYW